MAGELAKVRTNFLERVTMPVLSQLLDDILDDRIVNDDEKDFIVEAHRIRRDRAGYLLDTVKRKGDDASRKFMAHIQIRDPTLFSELGLSPPAPKPQMTDGSTTLIHGTEAFWRQKQCNDVYPVSINNARNRVSLLITNIKFKNPKMDREGAEKDEENMERLLKALGYEVVRHTNLTAKAIDNALIQFSKHPKLRETDSVVVCIMSHGELGIILGVDQTLETPDEFPIDNIHKHLGSANCPALINKPKIIIIQACRGDLPGAVLVSDGTTNKMEMQADNVQIAHREKDFISLLSSTPGTVSYRDPVLGSLLIRFVVQVFNTVACQDDIEELFRKVMQHFEDLRIFHRTETRQMSSKDRCTLTKRFYFFPGLGVV